MTAGDTAHFWVVAIVSALATLVSMALMVRDVGHRYVVIATAVALACLLLAYAIAYGVYRKKRSAHARTCGALAITTGICLFLVAFIAAAKYVRLPLRTLTASPSGFPAGGTAEFEAHAAELEKYKQGFDTVGRERYRELGQARMGAAVDKALALREGLGRQPPAKMPPFGAEWDKWRAEQAKQAWS
jgi:hypothetical protein